MSANPQRDAEPPRQYFDSDRLDEEFPLTFGDCVFIAVILICGLSGWAVALWLIFR